METGVGVLYVSCLRDVVSMSARRTHGGKGAHDGRGREGGRGSERERDDQEKKMNDGIRPSHPFNVLLEIK